MGNFLTITHLVLKWDKTLGQQKVVIGTKNGDGGEYFYSFYEFLGRV